MRINELASGVLSMAGGAETCPKGEEGLSGPMVSSALSYSSVTLIPGLKSSGAHSKTSALSNLTFHPPCELRTSGLHTSPFFSSSSLSPPHLCPSRPLAAPQRPAGSQEGMLSIWPELRSALWVHIRAPANVQDPGASRLMIGRQDPASSHPNTQGPVTPNPSYK